MEKMIEKMKLEEMKSKTAPEKKKKTDVKEKMWEKVEGKTQTILVQTYQMRK